MQNFLQIRAQLASVFSDVFKDAPKLLQLETLLYLSDLYQKHDRNYASFFSGAYLDYQKWCDLPVKHDDEELERQIAYDFTQLFCMGRGSVGTTASVILSPQRLHKREPWSNVSRYYRENGWKLPEKMNLFADSIPVEMAFYALQIESTGEADQEREVSLELQHTFLHNHLLIWLPQFSQQLRSSAGERSVYYWLSSYFLGFLEAEKYTLQNSLSPN